MNSVILRKNMMQPQWNQKEDFACLNFPSDVSVYWKLKEIMTYVECWFYKDYFYYNKAEYYLWILFFFLNKHYFTFLKLKWQH